MEKTYNPKAIEKKWQKFWLEQNCFSPSSGRKKKIFSAVMPPPNVTGSLHIGHALNNTFQDALVRYKKMKGFDVLWVPGTDHAGIATQMMVERELAKKNISKEQLGRKKFVKKVWEFKERFGDRIGRQLRMLGFIPDWSAERFTMDCRLSETVKTVFIRLYDQKLIYRANRLVNYDPKLKTAISDLEVEQREVKGNYWHINYPLKQESEHITVATTRPETMFGDSAVAVHPKDARYKKLVGKKVVLPLSGKTIPIIADAYSDPEKGSGAVKITPAHDFNDFAVGERHKLPVVNILDENARLNTEVPGPYQGLDRFEARKKIVADLAEGGFLKKTEKVNHTVPFGDRSGAVVEPWLMEQWFVDAKTMSARAIAAVEKGEMRFFPKFWERTYFQWMKNIEPWCISRGLWWGHRIPAWYAPGGELFVAQNAEAAEAAALKHFGKKVKLTRDPNVLDTWFSSGLWPFSTLNWPWNGEANEPLKRYYPTTVLVTGFDIIFFWVARMAMMGLHFTGKAPFRDICIHGLVRDEKGEKMSKTKGNVIDPLEVAEQFGADSLRFCLAALTAKGRDVELSFESVGGYRRFMNKIWNASRFIESVATTETGTGSRRGRAEKWIMSEAAIAAKRVGEYMESYDFGKAAQEIYRFFRNQFCDRYIEAAKLSIYGDDAKKKKTAKAVLVKVLGDSMRMLHPFCPHLTEEINEIHFGKGGLLDEKYPSADGALVKKYNTGRNEMRFIFEGVVDAIRIKRGSAGIKSSEKIKAVFFSEDEKTAGLVKEELAVISKLAGVAEAEFCGTEKQFSSAAGSPCPVSMKAQNPDGKDATKRFNLNIKIEARQKHALTEAETEILRKELEQVIKNAQKSEKKLGDPAFKKKAPAKIVEKEKGKLREFLNRRKALESELNKSPG